MTRRIYNYYRSDKDNERTTSPLETGRAQMESTRRAVVPLSFLSFTLHLLIHSYLFLLLLSSSSLSSSSSFSFLLLSLTLFYFHFLFPNSSFFPHMDSENQSPNARPDSPTFSSQAETDAPMSDSPPPSSSVPASQRRRSITSTVQPTGHYYHNNRNSRGQFIRASTGATAPAYITVQEETLLSVFTGRNILGAYSAMQAARDANASAFQYSFNVPAPPNLTLRPNQGIAPTTPYRPVNLSVPIDSLPPLAPSSLSSSAAHQSSNPLPHGTALLNRFSVLQETSSSHSLATAPNTIRRFSCNIPETNYPSSIALFVVVYPTSFLFPTTTPDTLISQTSPTFQVVSRMVTFPEYTYLHSIDTFTTSSAPPTSVDWTQTILAEFWFDVTTIPSFAVLNKKPATALYCLIQSWNREDCPFEIIVAAREFIPQLHNKHIPEDRVYQTPIPIPSTASTVPSPAAMPSSSSTSSPSALPPPLTLPTPPDPLEASLWSPASTSPTPPSSSSTSPPMKPPSPPPGADRETRSFTAKPGKSQDIGSAPAVPSTRFRGRARGHGRGGHTAASSAPAPPPITLIVVDDDTPIVIDDEEDDNDSVKSKEY